MGRPVHLPGHQIGKPTVNRDRIAVIIPCYNEAPTIARVVDNFRRELPEAAIYVYDNNSTDGTADIAAAAGAVVRRESRQGKGNVVRSMFRDIDAEYAEVDPLREDVIANIEEITGIITRR